MKNIRFLYNNLWDAGTLTYSSAHLNFPASNIRHRWHTKFWRSDTDTAEWLVLDAGADISCLAIALRNHNYTTAATIKIQGNAADAWGAPAFERTFTINDDLMIEFFTATRTYRWWRYYLNDAANPDGVLESGRIFLGGYFSPTMNFNKKYEYIHEDPSLIMFSEGGQSSSIIRPKYKRLVYTFTDMSAANVATLKAIYTDRGMTRDFFICQDADDRLAKSYYVRFAAPLEIEHIHGDIYFNVTIVLEELR